MTRTAALAAALVLLLGAPVASAVEHLDLPVAEAGSDQCSKLQQIKYPWLECKTNRYGASQIVTATVPANATWKEERKPWCAIRWHYHAYQCKRDHHGSH